MALRRAIVLSQAAGLWGMPAAGHCCRAAMQASCSASSASVKSRVAAMSAAEDAAGLLAEDALDGAGNTLPSLTYPSQRSLASHQRDGLDIRIRDQEMARRALPRSTWRRRCPPGHRLPRAKDSSPPW